MPVNEGDVDEFATFFSIEPDLRTNSHMQGSALMHTHMLKQVLNDDFTKIITNTKLSIGQDAAHPSNQHVNLNKKMLKDCTLTHLLRPPGFVCNVFFFQVSVCCNCCLLLGGTSVTKKKTP